MILFFYPNVSSLRARRDRRRLLPVPLRSFARLDRLLDIVKYRRLFFRNSYSPTVAYFCSRVYVEKPFPRFPREKSSARRALARPPEAFSNQSSASTHRASALHQNAFSKLVTRDDKRRQTGKETDIKLPRVDVRFEEGVGDIRGVPSSVLRRVCGWCRFEKSFGQDDGDVVIH